MGGGTELVRRAGAGGGDWRATEEASVGGTAGCEGGGVRCGSLGVFGAWCVRRLLISLRSDQSSCLSLIGFQIIRQD